MEGENFETANEKALAWYIENKEIIDANPVVLEELAGDCVENAPEKIFAL